MLLKDEFLEHAKVADITLKAEQSFCKISFSKKASLSVAYSCWSKFYWWFRRWVYQLLRDFLNRYCIEVWPSWHSKENVVSIISSFGISDVGYSDYTAFKSQLQENFVFSS